MAILLTAEVASVQNLHLVTKHLSDFHVFDKFVYPRNLKHEHSCAQDMACIVTPELDPCHLLLFVEVDSLNLVHGRLQVTVREQLLVRRDVGHLDVVAEHPEEDGFGGVGHEAFAAEGGFLEEPGQGAGVVQVEVRDEQEVDLRFNL